ncbi:DUF3068 domain-containing protein [Streptomyces muensis]|uniref:DUF3068 domain-containing protein n=1 Tax=Streptomyces muensis TaxID=1077944 RepID=A0A9X1TR45_STRM4|nr:DUF3068 domain-containing protein [Streptomyces muensis]MCF1599469.1 DUF3068 domain-containing protein [Streptomyces muensis]
MRRTASPLSLILLGLGTFLLVLAPMLAWYVTPRAAVNPIDIDTTAVYKGTGSVFDTDKIETVPDQEITVTQRVRGNVAESERSGNAVWDVITTVDTDKSLPAADPHDALDFTPHRWVMDRKTTRPVHCCEESPYIEGEAYLKFPFDVEKRSYQWWDNTGGTTITMRYDGTEKVQGYTGYRFTGTVAPRKVGTRLVPGSLVDEPDRPQVLAEEWYSNHGFKLVVDQATGRVVYAQTGPRRTLRAPGADKDAAVLLDSEKIAFTTATQKEAVRQAKRDSGQLRMVGRTLPIGAAGAGFVLAVVGGVLVVRGRKRPESTGAVEMPQPTLTI